MNWNNLKESKCPKCGYYLIKRELYSCGMCPFSIRIGKLINIVGQPRNLEKEATALLRHHVVQ